MPISRKPPAIGVAEGLDESFTHCSQQKNIRFVQAQSITTSSSGSSSSSGSILEIPTAEELFGPRPFQPTSIETAPPAWVGESIAVELADMECARLIANGLFDPPIAEEEIDQYARRYDLPRSQAEMELRRGRNGRT